MEYYNYIYPNPIELLAYVDAPNAVIVQNWSSTSSSADTRKVYFESSTNKFYVYITNSWQEKALSWVEENRLITRDTTINPDRILQLVSYQPKLLKRDGGKFYRPSIDGPDNDNRIFDDIMKDFIDDKDNFVGMTPYEAGVIENGSYTTARLQWRVANDIETEDYIAYDFPVGDVKKAKASLKRALARARLETYCFPKTLGQELMAIYHYDKINTTLDGNGTEFYQFRFDRETLQNAYNNWTFSNKIELGTAPFGTSERIQQSYNHGSIVGFHYPQPPTEENSLEPDQFEQVITKTLACFDLGDLPVPTLEEGESIYYQYSKFSDTWDEVEIAWTKQGGQNIWSQDDPTEKELIVSNGNSEGYLAIPVKLAEW